MGFLDGFNKARCGVGLHSGDWEWVRSGACDQTRRCARCSTLSERVSHGYGDWAYDEPENAASCWMTSECARCGEHRREQRHRVAWMYSIDWLEHRDDPTIATQLALAAVRVIGADDARCRQILVCERCLERVPPFEDHVEHDWGVWSVDRSSAVPRRACMRCGAVEEKAPE
jgi:hypothetical protein